MARRGGGMQVELFTDPQQTQMFVELMHELFEPKVSRKARQMREALDKLVTLRKQLGYQPELERQYASTFLYSPGLIRSLVRPSERQPELLFSPLEPDIKVKSPKTGRVVTPPLTSPLPPPEVEPLIRPEHRKELEDLATQLYPEDEDARRDFIASMVGKKLPTTIEERRYREIGKVEEFIAQHKQQQRQSLLDSGVDPKSIDESALEENARAAAKRAMPRSYSIWEDFHLYKRIQREDIKSRAEEREERIKLAKAKQQLAEARFQWQQQLAKSRESNLKATQNIKNAMQAYTLAQKAWRDEMALARSHRERQDRITMDLFKLGYVESPAFNAFDYQPEISFQDWLNTPSGSVWRDLIVRLGGEHLLLGQPRAQAPIQPPPISDKPKQWSEAEERMRHKFGFSPKR